MTTTQAPSPLSQALLDAAENKRLLVLDYDGTLAYLAVDWASVRRDLSRVALGFGFESDFRPLWDEMARFRDQLGLDKLSAMFRSLARHEEIGLDGQQARPEVIEAVRSVVSETGMNVAVFSLNLNQTVKAGLSKLDLEFVSVVMGVDDVARWKPYPDGLNRILSSVGVEPAHALMVGDSDRDSQAASTAGVEFFQV